MIKKSIIGLAFLGINLFAHPVSYTIDLEVNYDEKNGLASIVCKSNSRNKCGLYNIKLLSKDKKELANKRFPFLKDSTTVKVAKKPYELEFYLRKVPEHKYLMIFQ
ncbi:hypothetical protein [Halarcobacter sp.]|uniref:hypothetical protein n=1 Tax=Halarcobacter sp. TaxID=2321133 RepID=UPI002AA7298D|nr:hypothetical protein [Halarcobacter sp.]